MEVKFIRLGPTTLFKAPTCYGNYNVRCTLVTAICPVEHQCIVGQLPEMKVLEELNDMSKSKI